MLNDVQDMISQHQGLQDLLNSITSEDDGSDLNIGHIKANLGIEHDIGKDVSAATEAYNIAVCRALRATMRDTLPRELRDMVYSYLTGSTLRLLFKADTYNTNEIYNKSSSPHGGLAAQPRSPIDVLCPERFWRDAILSPEHDLELMESWHRTTIFEIGFAKPPSTCLQRLLSTDRLKSGFLPQNLISNINQRIDIISVGSPLAQSLASFLQAGIYSAGK